MDLIANNQIEIPTLITQPLLENCIKHGISNAVDNPSILMQFIRKDNFLFITIVDNGKGFNFIESQNGLGIKLSKERLQLIYGKEATLGFRRTNENTETILKLPIEND